jgi:hypothetical protein
MQSAKTSDKTRPNFIYRIVRISPVLKPFLPIIGTGLRLLLSSWEFPVAQPIGARNTRVPLTIEELNNINYIMGHARKSATAVIAAALYHAQHSHVRPPVKPTRSHSFAAAAD